MYWVSQWLQIGGDFVKQMRVMLVVWHWGKQRQSVSSSWNHIPLIWEEGFQVFLRETWCSLRSSGHCATWGPSIVWCGSHIIFLNSVNVLISLWPRVLFSWISWKQEFSVSSSITIGWGAHIRILAGTRDKTRYSQCSEGNYGLVVGDSREIITAWHYM